MCNKFYFSKEIFMLLFPFIWSLAEVDSECLRWHIVLTGWFCSIVNRNLKIWISESESWQILLKGNLKNVGFVSESQQLLLKGNFKKIKFSKIMNKSLFVLKLFTVQSLFWTRSLEVFDSENVFCNLCNNALE